MTLEAICICTVTRMLRGCPRHCPGQHATPESTHHMLIRILENQEKIMTAQSDIDAATAALTALTGDVATNVTQLVNVDVPAINAAIAALKAQGVDTTALDAAVAAASGTASSLDSAVGQVTAISSPPAAPSDGSGTPVGGGDGGTAS